MSAPAAISPAQFTSWRNVLFVLFTINGIGAASWAVRTPAIADGLGVGIGQMGALITGLPIGSIVAILLSSHVIHAVGARLSARLGLVAAAGGLALVGISVGVLGSYPLAFAGFVIYGFSNSTCNIVLNLEAAQVDRVGRRTLMPVFHAMFSVGTFLGAGLGTLAIIAKVPVDIHFGFVSCLLLGSAFLAVGRLPEPPEAVQGASATFARRMSVWVEPRTLLIGLVVLGAAFTEGTANNWLALSMVEDRSFTPAAGAAYLAVFTGSMTAGRFVGGMLVDRIGRVAALRSALSLSAVGLLLVILVPAPAVIAVGVVLWGLGASLGYPLGMSAAADNPDNAAARVAAVAAVGALAFLTGPTIIGVLGENSTLLTAFLVVLALVGMALAISGWARPLATRSSEDELSTGPATESL